MISFVVATLRSRWVAFIGIIVAASTAVALITAFGFLLETGLRGTVMPERLSRVPIVVGAEQTMSATSGVGADRETVTADATERRRLDAGVLATVLATSGVSSATPEVTFSAHLLDQDGSPITTPSGGSSWGHGWGSAASTAFTIEGGRAPASPNEIAIDADVARHAGVGVGDSVAIAAAGNTVDVIVSGTVAHAAGTLHHQSALFFTDTVAAEMYAHAGQADLLAVTVRPGADVNAVAAELRRVLGDDVAVLTGNARGSAEFVDQGNSSLALIAIAGSLGGIAAVVATMVIAGMLALIVQQRHREIALLRAIAATPRQVRRAITWETLTVVSVGAVIGVLPGIALATVVLGIWQDKGVVPEMFHSEHGMFPAVAAVLTTLIIGWAAARVAGGRASRIRPLEALSESSVQRARFGATRVATGALAVAGTVVVFKVAMSVDPYLAAALVPALVVLMFAVAAVLAPLFTMIGVRVVSLFTRRFGPTGYMAGMNSRSRTRRLASAVTPIVLAIGIAGMGLFQQSTSAAERSRQVRERIVAERVIAGGEVGLAPSIIDEVNTLDGVGPAIGIRHTEVFYGPDLDPSPAVGITAGNIADVLDLDVRSGSLGDLSAATTAISENMADQTDARLGTMLTVRLGDGYETTARVTAIYARSAGFADVILPQQLVAEHVTESNLDAVFVAVGTTATSDEPLQAIAARHPGAEVGDANIVQRGNDANETSQSWVGYLLMALVAAFAGIAVVNSLALSTAERTREFALMRLVGTTKRQVLRMLRWETLTVLLIGSTLGALVAVASLIPFSSTTTGRMMPSTPMLPCLALLGAAILLSLLGTQLPARLALRARPVDSIGIKQ